MTAGWTKWGVSGCVPGPPGAGFRAPGAAVARACHTNPHNLETSVTGAGYAPSMTRPRPQPLLRRFRSPLIAVLVLLPVLGCGAGARKPAQRFPVTVARAEERAVPYEILTTGTIEPRQTVSVGSQVGGLVIRLGFQEGDEVKAGQLLFQIDAQPFRAAYEQARAVLMKDQAQAVSAVADAERARALIPQGLISPQEAEGKQAQAAALTAQVRADSASLLNARLNLEYASIRAPVDGRTGALLVHRGDYVKPSTAEPLVTINTIHPILARFTIPERDMPAVLRRRDDGLVTRVSPADRDSNWATGKLVFVDNAVDRATGTLLLKAEFPNRDGALWPGEFVNVRLVLGVEARACVVPAQAVTNGQAGAIVYVLNADSTVTPHPVVVARTLEDVSVISSGVNPGDIVITDGQMRLAPGARVVVRQPAGGPGAGTGAAVAGAPGAAGAAGAGRR
jgi:multidrug efflux system membrane fusion protein